MKKSFSKIVSVVLAVIFAVSAMACMASAKVEGCPCECCEIGANSCPAKDDGVRDIYLVLDISGSMSGTPIKVLKEAAKKFCERMLDEKAGDNRIAIVTYATTVNSYVFSTDINELTATIDGVVAKGSTNMYDALMKVKDINNRFARSTASQHVVIMADGLPNESATLTEGKYTNKDSSMYYKHGNAVYSIASGMWFDYNVYSIGFFHNLGGRELKFGKVLMNDIQNTLYLEVFDPDKLVGAFIDIADCIVGCVCEEGCTCGDDYGCCECCTAGETTTEPTTAAPTTEPTTEPTTAPTTEPTTAKTGCGCDADCPCNGNCTDDCECGKDCNCGQKDEIPPLGESATGITAAAIIMLAGIAFIASKKKES